MEAIEFEEYSSEGQAFISCTDLTKYNRVEFLSAFENFRGVNKYKDIDVDDFPFRQLSFSKHRLRRYQIRDPNKDSDFNPDSNDDIGQDSPIPLRRDVEKIASSAVRNQMDVLWRGLAGYAPSL